MGSEEKWDFLSPEWFNGVAELVGNRLSASEVSDSSGWPDDFSTSVSLTVSGGPDGDRSGVWVIEAGTVTSGQGPADVELSLPVSESRQIMTGERSVNVAFMQGTLKASGAQADLLVLLRALHGEPARTLLAEVDGSTRY